MADEPKRYVLKTRDPNPPLELEVPDGFGEGVGWEDGASYHIEETARGFSLVRDERPV